MDRHTCKLCFLRFHNGRALGGHMRSHVMAASAASAYSPLLSRQPQLPPLSPSLASTSSTEMDDDKPSARQEPPTPCVVREGTKKRFDSPGFSSGGRAAARGESSVVQDGESDTESAVGSCFRRLLRSHRQPATTGARSRAYGLQVVVLVPWPPAWQYPRTPVWVRCSPGGGCCLREAWKLGTGHWVRERAGPSARAGFANCSPSLLVAAPALAVGRLAASPPLVLLAPSDSVGRLARFPLVSHLIFSTADRLFLPFAHTSLNGGGALHRPVSIGLLVRTNENVLCQGSPSPRASQPRSEGAFFLRVSVTRVLR
ncbi:unnamed protein product [Miscanthus lutarioriparius]|uniref:C2H2-type domain-containing protein n=1 Tax=Miscanthus lutarioriparius TaxID=422564 RepID=A0A811SK79_9POAL|nr:unnamed protein product [Miscanthus lutarioriparius]